MRGLGRRLVAAVMTVLEMLMERKTSVLTTGVFLLAVGAGFLSAAGALASLATRVRKLEKKEVGSDAGS
jgi:hypothetical protein